MLDCEYTPLDGVPVESDVEAIGRHEVTVIGWTAGLSYSFVCLPNPASTTFACFTRASVPEGGKGTGAGTMTGAGGTVDDGLTTGAEAMIGEDGTLDEDRTGAGRTGGIAAGRVPIEAGTTSEAAMLPERTSAGLTTTGAVVFAGRTGSG